MVKVVFLDWFGTICTGRIFSSRELDDNLFRNNRNMLYSWLRGTDTYGAVAEAIACESCPKDAVIEEIKENYGRLDFVKPAVAETIGKIRRGGKKVVLASDNTDLFNYITVKKLGLNKLFDHILNSHVLGVMKEDFDEEKGMPFFNAFLKDNALRPQDCVMFDDNPAIIGICRKYGLNVEHITDAENVCAALQKYI